MLLYVCPTDPFKGLPVGDPYRPKLALSVCRSLCVCVCACAGVQQSWPAFADFVVFLVAGFSVDPIGRPQAWANRDPL